MPSYKAPLRDQQFVLHELLGAVDVLKQMPRYADLDVDTVNQVVEEAARFCEDILQPTNRVGDEEGCTYDPVTKSVKTPTGFKEAYDAFREAGWQGLAADTRVRRPGSAAPAPDRVLRDAVLDQPGVGDVSGPDDRCPRVPGAARLAGAEGPVPAEDDVGPVDRDDVPDRAALRHRPRHAAHESRAAGRRQLQADRREDLHLLRRTRHGREHRAPGAGAPAGRAPGHEGHFAVHRAEVRAGRFGTRRHGRRPQRHLLRRPRAQDGNQRQLHVPDDPRRRERLAGRRAEQGPERDVRDDERRAARRRRAGSRHHGGRVPERGGLCARPDPGPLAGGPAGAGQAGRPHHRARGRASRAADRAGVRRGGPRVRVLGGADGRHADRRRRPRASQVRRGHDGADDADREGVHDRQRLPVRVGLHAGVRRPRLHPRQRAWSSSCAMPAST